MTINNCQIKASRFVVNWDLIIKCAVLFLVLSDDLEMLVTLRTQFTKSSRQYDIDEACFIM